MKPRKPIRKVSVRRARQNSEYTKLKRAFLRAHPWCQVCGNGERNVTLHHRRGRRGLRLVDSTHFVAACLPCHDRIHREPKWAKEQGWLESFL